MTDRSCDTSDRETRRLRTIFWLAIAIASLNALFAVLNARDLVYDGSFYLLAIAAHRVFHLIEPARVSVQMLQQMPAVIATRFGTRNLWTLGQMFSLGMSGWPVLITSLCWLALPRAEKSRIVGPLVNLVFVIPAANFIGIAEGIIASCLLWLAIFLVTFRLNRPVTAVLALLVSLASSLSHEAAAPCLLIIAWLAAGQIQCSKGMARITAALVVAVTVLGALYLTRWIVAPRSAIERGDFLVSLFGGFLGSPRAPNLQAIASLLAALFIGIAVAVRRYAWIAAVAGTLGVITCAVAFAEVPEAFASPGRYFAARGLPVVVTTALAAVLFLRRRGPSATPILSRPCITIFSALLIAQGLMQAVVTNLWRDYVRELRETVATHHGVLSHGEAMALIDGDASRFRRELLQTWSVQSLSILLAPGGRVTAVVQPAGTERWVPFNLQKPDTFPRMPQLDWAGFRAHPGS